MADINEEFPTLDDLNPDNDALALATEREEVAVGLKDYVSDDVPPATDPLPEESSPEADLAQRGLLGDPDDK